MLSTTSQSSEPNRDGPAAASAPVGPSTSGAPPAFLSLAGIVKQFGGATALDGVDFAVHGGEVHGLLGENGAGKTTLMNIACGILRADAGIIFVDGTEAGIRSPQDGFRNGLGIVHQSYRLIRNFTVAENLHVGWAATPRAASRKVLRSRTLELSERYGLPVNPDARIYDLSAGEAQRVAILRTLAHGARVLILDEPTALLTPREVDSLFETVSALAADGRAVVFVSHKLYEVMDICDRVTVVRRGRVVWESPKKDCTVELLARNMVGRDVVAAVRRPPSELGETVLALRGVTLASRADVPTLQDVDLDLRGGEIVGVAGVAGNGQPELAAVATGIVRPTDGTVMVAGSDLTGAPARDFIRAGIGHIAEDAAIGMALTESVETSAVMKSTHEPHLRTPFGLSPRRIREFTTDLLGAADLPGIEPGRRVNTLSGGQMQRLLVQRELRAGELVIIAAHPSRGLDVAATERVHTALIGAAERGAGILLISEDLDEILKLSDRVLVLYEGKVQGVFAQADAKRDEIGLLMGGARKDGPAARRTAGVPADD